MNFSSQIMNNGGSLANHNGRNLENFIKQILLQNNYKECTKSKTAILNNRINITEKLFMPQVYVGDTIYGTKRIVDFFILNKNLFPEGLIIECKWQQSKGSVDEKYPFLVLNIIKTKIPTIVLIDGGGYKPTAMQWLKEQAAPNNILMAVYTMAEFQKAINAKLL